VFVVEFVLAGSIVNPVILLWMTLGGGGLERPGQRGVPPSGTHLDGGISTVATGRWLRGGVAAARGGMDGQAQPKALVVAEARRGAD